MASSGDHPHRFGFTTRKLGSQSSLQRDSFVKSPKESVKTGSEVNQCQLEGTIDQSTDGRNVSVLDHNNQGIQKETKPFWEARNVKYRKETRPTTPIDLPLPFGITKPEVPNRAPSFVREKAISIPRSKIIKDLDSVIMRTTLSCSTPDTSDKFSPVDQILARDLIKTSYYNCENDEDAMKISMEAQMDVPKIHRHRTKRLHQKNPRPKWRKNTTQTPLVDFTCISVFGVCGLTSTPTTEDNSQDIITKNNKSQRKKLPQINKTRKVTGVGSDPHIPPQLHSLPEKTWHLAISRGSPLLTDASDVYVSGVNIHRVKESPVSPTPTTSQPKSDSNSLENTKCLDKSPEKHKELLQLSFPVFQGSSARRSPLLVWNDQQQMVALGRPKSVNERSPTGTPNIGKRFSLKNAPKQVSENSKIERTTKNGTTASDSQELEPHSKLSNKTLLDSLTNPCSFHKTHVTDGSTVLNQSSVFVKQPPQVQTPDIKCSIEPSLRMSQSSPKMIGISSNMLEFRSNSKSDISVIKAEKGARFRLCKPMLDTEDYEDFQHKKYKKNNSKYKRDKIDGVHLLRVKIGEF